MGLFLLFNFILQSTDFFLLQKCNLCHISASYTKKWFLLLINDIII